MLIKFLTENLWIYLVAGVMVLIVILNRIAKKREKEAKTLTLQLKNQHRKDFVFFCNFADYIDGDNEYIQMSGEANNTITLNTKVIDLNGKEHSLREIFVVGKGEVPTAMNGEEVTISVSSSNGWVVSQSGDSRPVYSPELQQLIQKIKEEKVVVLKLK
jgi:hypothetical protein